jgi:hypothetical protein
MFCFHLHCVRRKLNLAKQESPLKECRFSQTTTDHLTFSIPYLLHFESRPLPIHSHGPALLAPLLLVVLQGLIKRGAQLKKLELLGIKI